MRCFLRNQLDQESEKKAKKNTKKNDEKGEIADAQLIAQAQHSTAAPFPFTNCNCCRLANTDQPADQPAQAKERTSQLRVMRGLKVGRTTTSDDEVRRASTGKCLLGSPGNEQGAVYDSTV